jgi:hypothetical protein
MNITLPPITPGPWHYQWPNGKVLGCAEMHAHNTEHTSAPAIHAHHKSKATEEEKANAEAIAAVPDLLAALAFYADPANWKEQDTGIGMAPSECENDYGSAACAALLKAGATITE